MRFIIFFILFLGLAISLGSSLRLPLSGVLKPLQPPLTDADPVTNFLEDSEPANEEVKSPADSVSEGGDADKTEEAEEESEVGGTDVAEPPSEGPEEAEEEAEAGGTDVAEPPSEVAEPEEGIEPDPAEVLEPKPAEEIESKPVEAVEPVTTEAPCPRDETESQPEETIGSKPEETIESKPAETIESKPAETIESKPAETIESVPASEEKLSPVEGVAPPTAVTEVMSDKILQGIKQAEERPLCDDVIRSSEAKLGHRDGGHSWLEPVKSLIVSVKRPLDRDSDKDALASLVTLSQFLRFSGDVDADMINELISCGVDEIGRTILMKLIHRGFSKTVGSPLSWSSLTAADYPDIIYILDKEGNNLLHLAVGSRSQTVVSQVLHTIFNKVGKAGLQPYFENPNKTGLKPIDLARGSRMPPGVTSTLLDFYRSLYYEGSAKH